MATIDTSAQPEMETLLARIRPEVRREKAYRVALPPDVSVKLNQNESPFDLPEELKRELAERLRGIPFNRYPLDQPEALRHALAEHTGHDADGLLVGNGSNELTYTLGLTMIDEHVPVVLPRPMFALYTSVVGLFGGELVEVAPRADLSFDAEALVEAVRRRRPALTVLATPNNPTGLAMPLEEVEAVAAAAGEAEAGFVVVDEAYAEFNPEGSAQALLADHPHVLVMRTFSKAYGLAGLRLGYLMGRPAVIHELMKSRLPFMVGRFAEQAGLAVLERPDLLKEHVARMQAARRALAEALRGMAGVEVVPSVANFMLFKPEADPHRVMEGLVRRGVLVRDMGGYRELRGYLRVNAGTEAENKAFLAALEQALHEETPA